MTDTLVSALRAALPAPDNEAPDNAAAMRAAFAVARQAGLDDPVDDTPDAARALMRRMAIAGRADLPFARLFEGHVNAVQLVRAHGDPDQRRALADALQAGAILGVWNSDKPGDPLRIEGDGLAGGKNFASGAGIVTHPLVTVDANSPTDTRMLLVDLARTTVAVDRGWWHPIGMVRSETHIVDLTGVPLAHAAVIGAPGAYQRQPGFSAGALRFVAVQAGGVHALFDHVRAHLIATDRAGHPHQKHRLARLFVLADAGYALLDRTASAWTDAPRIVPLVAAARGAIEAIATEALSIAQASVGVQGLFAGHPLATTVTDLSVYLRQPNPDGARDATGEAAAAGIIVPGA